MARKKVNKMQAVRDAIQKFGVEVKPAQIVEYLKSEHGATISPEMASTYKGAILRQASGKKAGSSRVKASKRVTARSKSAKGAINLEDIKAVKELTDRLGAAKVRELASVLEK